MEKHQLVERVPDKKDKRANRIYLTPNGKKLFRSTFSIIQEAKTDLENGLTQKEIKTLINALKKVQGNINESKEIRTTN